MSKAARTLFRLFLRQARDLERQGIGELCIRAPLNKEAWMTGGQHTWAPPRDAWYLRSFQELAPWAAEGAASGCLTPAALRDVARRAFRAPPPPGGPGEQLDRAFSGLRMLGEQLAMHECSSSCVTDGVHVEVTTGYVGGQEELDATYEEEEGVPPKRYFTYRVRVSNVGEEAVQLLARHWVIQDAAGKVVAEVPKGSKGVVGCKPLIKPGDCFEYYSGTDLEGGGGTMHGSFQMAVVNPARPQDAWKRTFEADIAPFRFVLPANGGGGA